MYRLSIFKGDTVIHQQDGNSEEYLDGYGEGYLVGIGEEGLDCVVAKVS